MSRKNRALGCRCARTGGAAHGVNASLAWKSPARDYRRVEKWQNYAAGGARSGAAAPDGRLAPAVY